MEYNWLQKLNLEKIFKTESMWKLNFKGHKNKKKLYKISKDFCAKFLNKSVILKIITDFYWKKSRIFTYAELCRFPEKSNKKNTAIWWIHRSPQIELRTGRVNPDDPSGWPEKFRSGHWIVNLIRFGSTLIKSGLTRDPN